MFNSVHMAPGVSVHIWERYEWDTKPKFYPWRYWGQRGENEMRFVQRWKNALLCNKYLFVILQLVVQDDAVGLVGLGPGQGDAVNGAARLVHDGHCGWSCKKHKPVKSAVTTDASARHRFRVRLVQQCRMWRLVPHDAHGLSTANCIIKWSLFYWSLNISVKIQNYQVLHEICDALEKI